MRARLRLWNPNLFTDYRTKVIGNGDIHFIMGRHRNTGDWLIQAITFNYPSKKFRTVEDIYNWYQYHQSRSIKAHGGLKIEQGGKVLFGGLNSIDGSEPLHIQRLKAQRQSIPTFIIGYPQYDRCIFNGVELNEFIEDLKKQKEWTLNSYYCKKTTSPDIKKINDARWKWNPDSYNSLDRILSMYSQINIRSTYIDTHEDNNHYRYCSWYGTMSQAGIFIVVSHSCDSWWKVNP